MDDNQEFNEQPVEPVQSDAILPVENESEEKLVRLEKEVADLKDKNLRLYAEFDNARKRMDRDRVEFVKYANEKLIVDFLGVLDNLERTVEAAKAKHEDYEAFLQGIEMVMKEIMTLLAKNGVKAIEAKGKKFDPHCQEVLLMEDADNVEEGTVLEELQKGYYVGDHVARTSKVKLAKKKSETE